MDQITAAFSGFSVNDKEKAKEFYVSTLGLELLDETMGLRFKLPSGGAVFVYEKQDHQPATFTILNFIVKNIDAAVDELVKRGVSFEHYDNAIKTDEKGIARGKSSGMGPDIAWFKDPAGNILSVIEEDVQ
jgi:catechol 2,3-dioxygenase-like lactoylglutathione lyase family enzyme